MIEQNIPGGDSKFSSRTEIRVRPEFSVRRASASRSVILGLAALAAFLTSPGRSAAQQCGTAVSINTHTSNYPANTRSAKKFHIGRSRSVLYNATVVGVATTDLTGDPANPPAPSVFQIGVKGGGPIGSPTNDACWQGPSSMNAAEASDGSGRIISDWTACGDPAQLVVMGVGSSKSFGQQLVPGTTSSGADIPVQQSMDVFKSGSSYFAYFIDNSTDAIVRVVNVTNPNGSTDPNTPIVGNATSWSGALSVAVGHSSQDDVLFASTDSGILAGQVSPTTGALTTLATYAGSAKGRLEIFYTSTGFWVFNRNSTAIDIVLYDPGQKKFSKLGAIPQPGTDPYNESHVAGLANSPVVFARHPSSGVIDVYSTGFISAHTAASVNLQIGKVPLDLSASGWEVLVAQGTGGKVLAYVYKPASNPDTSITEPQLRADTYDISCVAAPPGPPISALTVTNLAGHVGADPTNYVGDTYKIQDASTGSPTSDQWDLNYTGSWSQDVSLGTGLTFNAILPCDPAAGGNISSGSGCYTPASPPSSQTVANKATNTYGTSTTPGTKAVTLVKPLSVVKNFSGGSVNILSGQAIDASPTQGSPSSFTWTLSNKSSSCTTATCTPASGDTSFSVKSNYPGGYVSPAVSGTITQAAVIPGFTVPATALYNQTFTATNNTQCGAVSNVTYAYTIDQNTGHSTAPFASAATFSPTPCSLLGTASLTPPAGVTLNSNYYVHFRVSYTGTPAGPVYFDTPAMQFTNVSYTPHLTIGGSGWVPNLFQPSLSYAKVGVAVTFSDTGDTGKVATAATWDFGDGTAVFNGTTASTPSHTYQVVGTFTAKLTVGAAQDTFTFQVKSATPPPPPPPSGLSVSIGGVSSIVVNQQGSWTASVSGAAGAVSYAWTVNGTPAGQGSSLSYTFPAAGSNSIAVSVNDGTSTASASKSINVTLPSNLAVTISGPSVVPAGTNGTWTANITGAAGATTATWLISDSSFPVGHGASVTHSIETTGPYTVQVSVTDGIGTATASLNFTVSSATGCVPDSQTLCLNSGRFKIQVSWQAQTANPPTSGAGQAVTLPGGTGDTGYFWFFTPGNAELVVKVVDGSSFNNFFWVFYGALSNIQYTITVTDMSTSAVKTYFNAQGNLASVADTAAFPSP